MARYNNPAMAQLSRQQVRYAPRSVRLKQIERAERFVDRLHPERFYAYQDVCEELTGYRSEKYPDLQLSGHEAIRDLRCLVEDLSDSLDLSVSDVGEPVLTIDECPSGTTSRPRPSIAGVTGSGVAKFLVDGRKRVGSSSRPLIDFRGGTLPKSTGVEIFARRRT
ncbi:MAG: hypothetical protein CM1200mP2_00190 [Planctomycetaceae bacterium]|nr:MAG: hypothetical protein CM1200mP2_00190 [Planctomycetaceae bacterium]